MDMGSRGSARLLLAANLAMAFPPTLFTVQRQESLLRDASSVHIHSLNKPEGRTTFFSYLL